METEKSAMEDSIRKRINRVLDNHIGGVENTEALKIISSFCNTNSEGARRTLKNDIERRDLLSSKSILEGFGKLKQKLDDLHGNISSMNNVVNNMSCRLQESKTKTKRLIEQTSKMTAEGKRADKKLAFVEAFLKHFELSPHQIEMLHGKSKDTPITPEFFVALKQIESMYNDCKVLIRSGFETSAIDIMEKVGLHQEAAVERLYRWTIHASRNIDLPSNALVPQALAKLQNREVLFSNIIDEYCTSRKSNIVRNFIDALTRERESGSKPIEFYANDPKRYIGDILTWVYQVIPVEKENLSLFLKKCEEIDKNQQMADCLTCIMEAVCPPLKVRAELIVKPDKDPVVLSSITNLIKYYRSTIMEMLKGGQLNVTLDELLKQSEESFLMALDSKIQRELSHGVKAPPSNLTPSPIVTDLLSFLREVLSSTSMSDEKDNVNVKVIVSHVLDPLLHAINETACHLSSTDMAVYLLNCIYHVQCTLSLYPNMEERNERLQAQSDAQIDTLTSEQASCLVANLNMGPIYTILQEKSKGPLSAIPGMDPAILKNFLNKFDGFILNPDMYVLPQLALLISITQKNTVQKRSFEVIIAIYKQLYSAIHDPSNNYADPEQIIKKTPDEITKLLSIA